MTAALSKIIPEPAPLNEAVTSETRVLLEGISWETYERLLTERGIAAISSWPIGMGF